MTAAYLNANLKEDIYVIPPEGMSTNKSHVWKLNKAIYGLKQSGREWNEELNNKLKEYGMKRSLADPCIYIKGEGKNKIVGSMSTIFLSSQAMKTREKT